MISVIVPVFNVEKYVSKCIESIINQTFKDLELILVNDGSTDNSLSICFEWKDKDERIIVFSQNNQGLSAARNAGLALAKGEYVSFIDSDDAIEKNYFDELFKAMVNSGKQITCCDFLLVYKDYVKRHELKSDMIYSRDEALNELFFINDTAENSKIYVMTCGKLYNKRLFDDIKFPVGMLHEDVATTYKIIDKSNGCYFTNKTNYLYLQREDSIMGQMNSQKRNKVKNYQDYNQIYEEQIQYFAATRRNEFVIAAIETKLRRMLYGYVIEGNKETKLYIKEQLSKFDKEQIKLIKSKRLIVSKQLYNISPLLYKLIRSTYAKIKIIRGRK